MISQPPIIGDYKKVRKITRRGGREGQKKGKKKEIEKKKKEIRKAYRSRNKGFSLLLLGLEIRRKKGSIRNPFLFEDFKLGRYILVSFESEAYEVC